MKTIKIALMLFVFCACYHLSNAQSITRSKDIRKENFTVNLKIGPKNQLSQVTFKTSKGKKLKSTILDKRALAGLKLKPGTTVQGTFRFGQLSGTDLGSGRVYSGSGTLLFDKVMKPNGQKVGCPPLCDNSVQLEVRLQE